MRTLLIAAMLLAACGDDHAASRKRAPACQTCVVHELALPAPRGEIRDRRGVPLAVNRPAQDLHVTPTAFDAPARDALIRALALDADEVSQMDTIVERARKRSRLASVAVLTAVTPARASQAAALTGVELRPGVTRDYPEGALAAHVLGYLSPMTDAELDRLGALGYEQAEHIGRYGIEREWESYLRGKPGRELYVTDAHGQVVEDPDVITAVIQGTPRLEPVAGLELVLTIDARLQRLAEDAVASQPAAAVAVIEVATGKLLALVSKPSFDPRAMSAGLSRAAYDALINDPNKPFLDRTLHETYPPGPTFAFVTALAALEDGFTTCALVRGCDASVAQLAERVGLDRIAEEARAYGFGTPTGLGLNGDAAGQIPTKAFYDQLGFKIGHTLNTAAGEGDVEVTLLQLVTAYAALASGTRFVPQLVERVQRANGQVVTAFDPRVAATVSTDPAILDLLRQAMRDGQAGTAHARKHQHAWFAGWAPEDAPEIAIVVLIPDGGDGAAVPVARTILERWWTEVR